MLASLALRRMGVPCCFCFGEGTASWGGGPKRGASVPARASGGDLSGQGSNRGGSRDMQVVGEGLREEAHEEDPRGAGENGDQSDEYGAG